MPDSSEKRTAAEMQRTSDEALDKHVETIRKRDTEGGVVEVPKPVHGDPAEAAPPAPGDTVIGVRTGSEAAVESGTGPVLPLMGPGASAFTRVRNRDLRERDQQEFRRRGLRSDGAARAGVPISVTFEGAMMVERAEDDGGNQLVNGSFTGVIPEDGLRIRPLSAKEEQEYFGAPVQANQRSNDLVAGSGTGGGGNPMHAGRTRGTSSQTAQRVGEGGVTSQSGPAPAPRPNNAGPVTPQGGGRDSRG